jgi:hypothetical protein
MGVKFSCTLSAGVVEVAARAIPAVKNTCFLGIYKGNEQIGRKSMNLLIERNCGFVCGGVASLLISIYHTQGEHVEGRNHHVANNHGVCHVAPPAPDLV